ncbi:MAG: ribulose-phosphate 3-epimerase [Spirochaetaceae bacterium]|jgi:ribulose-phosphate 3-epimerase|nr:ribulose-phosphate 3-epimerase [Spirochaetaceae bacterium]
MESPILAPSLLSADFSDLGAALGRIREGGGSMVHFDVMDGVFVPEITYGQVVLRSLRKKTALPFDVHLMVERPEGQIESFAQAGADWITFHAEAAAGGAGLVEKIHSLGKKAGVAIAPSTPIGALEGLLPAADLALVMGVHPGFGGQGMIPGCVEKIAALGALRKKAGLSFLISVDGGVNAATLGPVIEAGADIIVSGSAFFSGQLNWRAR